MAALARHTADNYQRIAAFVQISDRMSAAHGSSRHDGDEYTAGNFDLGALATQLSVACGGFGHVAELTNVQLDAIPPKDSFRFCDGQRTLDEVLANLLKHQRHQLDTLRAAVPARPSAA